MYITTSPDDPTDYPDAPSYDYDDIVVQHTSPAPEFHTVKVTTFAPDERYLQNIRAPPVQRTKPEDILTKLQKNNHLPETLSVDNVDNSIKTLAKILENIKQNEVLPKPVAPPTKFDDGDYDYANYGNDDDGNARFLLN